MTCRVCGNSSDNRAFMAREMMHGLREQFEYFECAACGSVQIRDIPQDLGKYYAADYYSLQRAVEPPAGLLKRFLKRKRVQHWAKGNTLVGRLIARRSAAWPYFAWLRRTHTDFKDSILDVGSGSGTFLLRLHSDGFRNLVGIDPNIAEDVSYPAGIQVFKRHLQEMTGAFDLITLVHSFEHMSEPLQALQHCKRLLRPQKYLAIATPVAGSFAHRKYGANWVALDAPRHLIIHTPKSMKILAQLAGLELVDVIYESDATQFFASEMYLRDIPLVEYWKNPQQGIFSAEELHSFSREAERLNSAGDGDCACFILRNTA